MTLKVADIRANLNENIRHAARIIGKSEARLRVFEVIYRGKQKVKTVAEIARATGLNNIRVLQEGGKLAGNGIVDQVKVSGATGYKKDDTLVHHKKAIIDLCHHPKKAARYPTKQEPRAHATTTYRFSVGKTLPQPIEVTIDDLKCFENAAVNDSTQHSDLSRVPESRVKEFLKLVVGETGTFTDWGGEKNDLYTNKLWYKGKRHSAAIAIKGKATKGPLTPKKMGKNGDQIGRLMASEADVFLIVYHGKIEQSIPEQLRAFAVARSFAGRRTYYGTIDGQDLNRLVVGYSKEWRASR